MNKKNKKKRRKRRKRRKQRTGKTLLLLLLLAVQWYSHCSSSLPFDGFCFRQYFRILPLVSFLYFLMCFVCVCVCVVFEKARRTAKKYTRTHKGASRWFYTWICCLRLFAFSFHSSFMNSLFSFHFSAIAGERWHSFIFCFVLFEMKMRMLLFSRLNHVVLYLDFFLWDSLWAFSLIYNMWPNEMIHMLTYKC